MSTRNASALAACWLLAAACGSGGPDPVCSAASGCLSSIGDACQVRTDCGDVALNCYSARSGFPGGYCAISCAGAVCPAGSACVDASGATAAGRVCLKSCATWTDCRPDHDCAPPPDGSPGKVCEPPGWNVSFGPVPTSTSWTLRNGGTVGPASRPSGCQKPIGAVVQPAGRAQPLGVHKVGETVQFQVPPGTGTISILSQASAGVVATLTITDSLGPFPLDNAAIPTLVRAPGGTVYYDDNADPPADLTRVRYFFGPPEPATAALTMPNTTGALADSGAGYPAGTWSFVANDFAYECALGQVPPGQTCTGGSRAGTYDLTVITKPIAGSTGLLDLGLYLATPTMSATSTAADPQVARFLATLSALYAKAGLSLGAVTVYDLPAWAKALYASGVDVTRTGPCDELGQMFTLSQPGNALNLFFVDAIQQSGRTSAGTIVGLDGAIPGPSGAGGTVHSGAVVNVSDLAFGHCGSSIDVRVCGADETAYIAAHEGGHWMGLFHTTEQLGVDFDPVADTPTCACTAACVGAQAAQACCDVATGRNCGYLGTLVTGANCSKTGSAPCGGGGNLMFWLFDGAAAGTLTPEQSRILRANPLVQ